MLTTFRNLRIRTKYFLPSKRVDLSASENFFRDQKLFAKNYPKPRLKLENYDLRKVPREDGGIFLISNGN